jgi:hypothetical protein
LEEDESLLKGVLSLSKEDESLSKGVLSLLEEDESLSKGVLSLPEEDESLPDILISPRNTVSDLRNAVPAPRNIFIGVADTVHTLAKAMGLPLHPALLIRALESGLLLLPGFLQPPEIRPRQSVVLT